MQIIIAAATRLELNEAFLMQKSKCKITILYTGVGMLATAVSLMQHVLQQKPDLIIQAGIAGSFDKNVMLENVVAVQNESLGDVGVQEKNEWNDLFDMGFQQANEMPFFDKFLPNSKLNKYNVLRLPQVNGVTINQITTSAAAITMLQAKYNAQIESMEGAALHYVCRLYNIPFIQIRAISNFVGERNKKEWKIKEAIKNLNEAVAEMLKDERLTVVD